MKPSRESRTSAITNTQLFLEEYLRMKVIKWLRFL